jgi:hypothetical protein
LYNRQSKSASEIAVEQAAEKLFSPVKISLSGLSRH